MLGFSYPDLIIIAVYLGIMIAIGLASRNRVHSIGEYFMANRAFGKLYMVAQTFGTGTHTAQPVSVAGASYTAGISGIWYQWMWLFSTPFYWLLAPVYRRLRYLTMADFFRERYGSRMALLYVLIGLLFFCMNIGLVLKSAGFIISGVSDGAISTNLSVMVITLLFLLYGLIGGLQAIVITDLIQGVLTLIMSFMILPYAFFRVGSLSAVHNGLPQHMFDLVAAGEMNLFFVTMIVINGLVGVVVHPHHMAINGSGRTELACRLGWTLGTFLKRFSTIGWAFVGVFAAFLFPGIDFDHRELAFGIAARNLLPAGMIGLMMTALLAAGMSTCDGFMVHASALLTQNIYCVYINPQADDATKLRAGRFFSVLVVFGGILFAALFNSVVQGLLALLKVCSFLGVSFWAGIIWRRANRYGALGSVATMVLVVLISDYFFSFGQATQIALYLSCGILAMILISKITRPEPAGQMKKFYSLLNTPVGKEQQLLDAGIPIIFPGLHSDQNEKSFWRKLFPRANEAGLLIVDALSLRKLFSVQRYRTDLLGFLLSSLLVLFLLLLLYFLANLGST